MISSKALARREGRGQILVLRALRFIEDVGLAGLDGAPIALIAQVASLRPTTVEGPIRTAFGLRRVTRSTLLTGKDDGVPWRHHCYHVSPGGHRWLAWVDAQPDIAPDRWRDPIRFEVWRRTGVAPPRRPTFGLSPKSHAWPPNLRGVPTFLP